MRKLEFIGTLNGQVAHEMVIPGRNKLFLKPDDWPTRLAWNLRPTQDRFEGRAVRENGGVLGLPPRQLLSEARPEMKALLVRIGVDQEKALARCRSSWRTRLHQRNPACVSERIV
jgi:hypothetical protein